MGVIIPPTLARLGVISRPCKAAATFWVTGHCKQRPNPVVEHGNIDLTMENGKSPSLPKHPWRSFDHLICYHFHHETLSFKFQQSCNPSMDLHLTSTSFWSQGGWCVPQFHHRNQQFDKFPSATHPTRCHPLSVGMSRNSGFNTSTKSSGAVTSNRKLCKNQAGNPTTWLFFCMSEKRASFASIPWDFVDWNGWGSHIWQQRGKSNPFRSAEGNNFYLNGFNLGTGPSHIMANMKRKGLYSQYSPKQTSRWHPKGSGLWPKDCCNKAAAP